MRIINLIFTSGFAHAAPQTASCVPIKNGTLSLIAFLALIITNRANAVSSFVVTGEEADLPYHAGACTVDEQDAAKIEAKANAIQSALIQCKAGVSILEEWQFLGGPKSLPVCIGTYKATNEFSCNFPGHQFTESVEVQGSYYPARDTAYSEAISLAQLECGSATFRVSNWSIATDNMTSTVRASAAFECTEHK